MFGSNKIVARLDTMLTDAINGVFTESNYDETQLSRLESKFRQYLTGKEAAGEKVQAERAAIKELVTDISAFIPSSWRKPAPRKPFLWCGRATSRRKNLNF